MNLYSTNEEMAERLGLTAFDQVLLLAQECGLIPSEAERRQLDDWWDEQYERAQLAIEAWYEAGRDD